VQRVVAFDCEGEAFAEELTESDAQAHCGPASATRGAMGRLDPEIDTRSKESCHHGRHTFLAGGSLEEQMGLGRACSANVQRKACPPSSPMARFCLVVAGTPFTCEGENTKAPQDQVVEMGR